MKYPCNERFVVEGCATGELSIDEAGRVWRHKARRGTGKPGIVCLTDVPKRRAEYQHYTGYLFVGRRTANKEYRTTAARLVWQYFYGDIPDRLCINHKNGIKTDNRPENLELVTPQENMLHAVRTALQPTGGHHPRSKLCEADVLEIRRRWKSGGVLQRELAEEYGVTRSTIQHITSGYNWKHLKEEVSYKLIP